MKYRIDTERTPPESLMGDPEEPFDFEQACADFELYGDESFEWGSMLCDSLAYAENAALEELGFESLDEMMEATRSGVTVKIVGRDIWLKIIP